jgi:intracellular sulfur oxidation DsrE/DsrF family protein
MKTLKFLCLLLLFSTQLSFAQKVPYNVVFDVTGKDSVVQRSVIRWVNEISNSDPDAMIEVVMYGHGLDLVTKNKSAFSDDVTRLAQNKNISFKVCAIAMKNNNINPDQLLQNVSTVPDGIYEIISKQAKGWGYIKVAP